MKAQFGPLGLAVFSLVLAVSACGGGTDAPRRTSPPPKPQTAAPGTARLLMAEPMAHKTGAAHVELWELSRTTDKTITGRFRIVNDGQSPLDLTTSLLEQGLDNGGFNLGGAALVDAQNNRLYMPMRTTDNKCLCSDLSGRPVPPNQGLDLYAVFSAPPADVTKVTINMPLTVPFQDVQVGSGSVSAVPDQIDPATAALAPARSFSVSSIVEGEEESVDEDAANRSVRLSADVLFALNKADLTPRADGVLKSLAQQINASTGSSVKIDGYTDTSGNDAINQPLSERRARSVQTRLKTLVTRQGVSYESAGHGSEDPVASNDSDTGRRRNRRVTVTFARPAPPARTAAPAPAGTPFQRSQGNAPVLGTAEFKVPAAKDVKVEVNGLHRDQTGLTTLAWTVKNTGTGEISVGSMFEKSEALHGGGAPHRGATTGGVMLVDTTAKNRYEPLQVENGQCLCTSLILDAKTTLGPGESITYSDLYKLPADLRKVDVQVPWLSSEFATVSGITVQ
jgi:outer membrane protein OmpA-like peptidoglycan-associated protein